MTVLWYVARGIQIERGGFALYIVQGDSQCKATLSTRPETVCRVVQESGDGGRKNGKITKMLLLKMFQKSKKMK